MSKLVENVENIHEMLKLEENVRALKQVDMSFSRFVITSYKNPNLVRVNFCPTHDSFLLIMIGLCYCRKMEREIEDSCGGDNALPPS